MNNKVSSRPDAMVWKCIHHSSRLNFDMFLSTNNLMVRYHINYSQKNLSMRLDHMWEPLYLEGTHILLWDRKEICCLLIFLYVICLYVPRCSWETHVQRSILLGLFQNMKVNSCLITWILFAFVSLTPVWELGVLWVNWIILLWRGWPWPRFQSSHTRFLDCWLC